MSLTLFERNALEHIQNLVVEQDFPERMMASGRLVPIDSSLPAWVESYVYKILTKVGSAKILANGANDLPEVSAYLEERTGYIRTIANQYSYTYQEMEQARTANVPLDSTLAITAREVMEQELDNVAWNGASEHNLQGFISHPNVPSYTIPNDGTGTSTLWSTKTAAQIYRDLTNFAKETRTATKYVEMPEIILISSEHFDTLVETEYPVQTGKTILSFFLENQRQFSGGVRQVIPVPYLSGKGAGTTGMMISFRPRADKIRFHVPQDFMSLPPERKGLDYLTPNMMRTGGIQLLKPFSMRYAEGL